MKNFSYSQIHNREGGDLLTHPLAIFIEYFLSRKMCFESQSVFLWLKLILIHLSLVGSARILQTRTSHKWSSIFWGLPRFDPFPSTGDTSQSRAHVCHVSGGNHQTAGWRSAAFRTQVCLYILSICCFSPWHIKLINCKLINYYNQCMLHSSQCGHFEKVTTDEGVYTMCNSKKIWIRLQMK